MAEIIKPATGLLIALQHPITPDLFHKEDISKGPPFLVSPELYSHLRIVVMSGMRNFWDPILKGFILNGRRKVMKWGQRI